MQAGLAPSVEPIDFFHADCLPIEPEHFTRRPEGQLAKTAISLKTPVAASMSVNREVRHTVGPWGQTLRGRIGNHILNVTWNLVQVGL
jgi:hypothetical protein